MEGQCPDAEHWPRRCYPCAHWDLDAALRTPVGRATLAAVDAWKCMRAGVRIGRAELSWMECEALLEFDKQWKEHESELAEQASRRRGR